MCTRRWQGWAAGNRNELWTLELLRGQKGMRGQKVFTCPHRRSKPSGLWHRTAAADAA